MRHREAKTSTHKAAGAPQGKAALHGKLRAALGEEGRHFTRQRAAVFEYLSGVTHHPTADDVFIAVKRRLPKISLATVYKNLEALVACGTASKLTSGDVAARYEIRRDPHYHTRCLKCGSLTDLEARASEQLAKLLKPPGGFRVEAYRIELLGCCRGCR